MSNSSLVTYTKISPNRTSPRTHAIDTITIHCLVGQWTAKQIGDYFANSNVQASPNYGVGKDGSIALCVPECDRSWCTSSRANDHRAVTVEVASDTTHPYAVTDAAYQTLIRLVADVCQRNGIKKLVWSTDKTTRVNHLNGCNMTVHRDYANKACPGEYLYSRHGQIADAVNAILNSEKEDDTMTGEQIYNALKEYLAKGSVSEKVGAELQEAVSVGITDGSNPTQYVTRAQAAVMALRAAQYAVEAGGGCRDCRVQ